MNSKLKHTFLLGSLALNVKESNNNYYQIDFEFYDLMYDCKKMNMQNITIRNTYYKNNGLG